ncbi:O-antigen ligase domain-containing protein [Leptolyngbya sp. FACHB-36]|uniref:O-antigen ligase domain-containing protein n=1 Tax=Leptolyngbya sp. FACHB-36 TaxID=2692808 RepID=UPI001680A16D|nr:O-antigen ligase domain-containing protein [Leptolyngbya sp. FACHB-36]MBD2022180.1 O-antigen ligase domain-containing protein [Leptolyngbya sp. FACHB-36]
MQGNAIAFLALLGWLPFVIYLFSRYPAQRALIVGVLGAWLFLPLSSMKIPVVPAYDKMAAAFYGVLAATAIYDMGRLQAFSFSWIDVPMIIWCICPFFSSMTNDLGPYDGFVMMLGQIVTWGLPYLIGRIYLNSLSGMRQLAVGFFVGGLLYILPCLYEIRLFTSLHARVYGFAPVENFLISIRYGGYRPSVFLSHGLAVGVWMMSATLMGITLWRAKILKKIWNIPIAPLAVILLVTFILVKSTGAYFLLALALIILFVGKWLRTAFLMWVIVAGICLYLNLGVTGGFPREPIVSYLYQNFSPERIQSLDFRFVNEEILSAKAREKILFGWGGFGRNRVYDESGKDISVTDSLWIIVFGVNGAVGLASVFGSLLLPVVSFCTKFPARLWSNPRVAPAAALAVSVVMYSLDCVLNAMVNPTFALVCGGLAGLVVAPQRESH